MLFNEKCEAVEIKGEEERKGKYLRGGGRLKDRKKRGALHEITSFRNLVIPFP